MGTPVDIDVKRRIIDTLSDHVYIPVFRTMDLSTPAYIGEPWSPCASSMEFQPVALQNGSETDAASPKPPMSPFGRSPSLGSPLLVARSGGKQTSSSPSKWNLNLTNEKLPEVHFSVLWLNFFAILL